MKILITCIHYADDNNNIRARKCKIIVDENKLEKYINKWEASVEAMEYYRKGSLAFVGLMYGN